MHNSDGKWPDPPPNLETDPVDHDHLDRRGIKKYLETREVRPYLGLHARLSQIWFNRWTVLLLLVLFRVLLLVGSLNKDIGDAKVKALSACTKVEDIGIAMASMPHYLSVGVNALTATGITKAVHGMMEILDMILTGVEQLILFVIHMMTDTYVCLISMAVHGGLNISAFVVEKTTDAMNDVVSGLADDIGHIANGVQDAIDGAWGSIDAVGSVFGGKGIPAKPDFNISKDVDQLKNIKINSDGFVADLTKLEQDVPTFDDVRNFTNNAVAIPFDYIKKKLNESYGGWKFDENVFPVAQKETLSFCSENSDINDFFQHLFEVAAFAKRAFVGVICTLAILACVVMGYWEICRWRRMKDHEKRFKQEQCDDLDFSNMMACPLTSRVGLKVAGWFSGKNERRKHLWRWCVAYGTSLPAVFVLSLALAGLFSCLCQAILLKAISNEVPALNQQVGDFAGDVVATLEHVSENWANDANGVITTFTDDINKDVLGYVTNATDAVNDTLNVFISEMEKGLNTVFGGTILENPIKDVVRCLIGLKIESVQKGLTWVHDHAKVSLPLFPNDTFSAGAQKSLSSDSVLTPFLSSRSTVTTDEISRAVNKITEMIRNSIIQEALISTGLLLVYILIILMGIVRTLSALPGGDCSSSRQLPKDSDPFGDANKSNMTETKLPFPQSRSKYGESKAAKSY